MRWLINYIRSCFCKHEWELLEKTTVQRDTDYYGRKVERHNIGTKWLYRCKKCGLDKMYKNY